MAPRVRPAHGMQTAPHAAHGVMAHMAPASWHHLIRTAHQQRTNNAHMLPRCQPAPTARAQALARRCICCTACFLPPPDSYIPTTGGVWPCCKPVSTAHMHGTTMCCIYSQPTASLNLHCQTRFNAPSLPAAVRVLLRYMQSFHPQPRLQSSMKVGHPVTPCPPVAVYAKTPACWCMDVCCPDKSSWE